MTMEEFKELESLKKENEALELANKWNQETIQMLNERINQLEYENKSLKFKGE